MASGTGAILAGVETTRLEAMKGADVLRLATPCAATPNPGPRDGSAIEATLTALQRMIREILDPLALQKRSVKEWRSLYKSFFAFFASDGGADETERKAWAIATDVFNTNLVAVCNRKTQVVPMTFQDFVDGVDSFRHDGLREGAQRDIAWQPKKILLLMAAMIGRIVAGWQADADSSPERSTNLFPFREYLIAANRKDSFLGSVFDYDPRFSILDYGAAGLKPLLQAFPHFAFAIMENGILRCELCSAQVPQNPPLLRIHFLKPLRAPVPPGTLSTLYLVVLRRAASFNAGSSDSKEETSYFESSRAALDALAFEPCDAFEIKCSKVERLFELAVTGELLVCGPHRAEASTAARIGKTLGRTQAEQFVIERFFTLGFRSGHGNEPWLERSASAAPDTDKIKKARKQFSHWKNTALFFRKAGRPQGMDLPGASIRQEALQFKDSALFPSLIANPVYEPVMSLFLTADTEGRWVVDEPELHAFARNLNSGAGKVISEAGEAIACCAESFQDPEMQSVFLFECSMGILLSAVGAHKNAKRLSKLKRAKDSLRQNYEQTFAVSLSRAPSVLWATATEHAAQLVETENKLEETEQAIMGLLAEPLSRKVSDNLQAILDDLPKPAAPLADQPVPLIRLENHTTFEESITGLYNWLKSNFSRESGSRLSATGQFLRDCAELRRLAEEGKTEEALAKSSVLYPTLSETRKKALAPILGELTCSLLQAIERERDRGNTERAIGLAENAKAIIEGTPFRDDFKSLFQTLFTPGPGREVTERPAPSTASSTRAAQRARILQAEVLLRDYADELGMDENQLEREFLRAVENGSDAEFKKREKLKNRLQRRTRWGGREPYRTTLKLLESVPGRDT